MIRVSLARLILIYLFLLLGVIFAEWIRYRLQKGRDAEKNNKYRLRCACCAYDFLDESETELPRCPRCGSLNERSKFSAL